MLPNLSKEENERSQMMAYIRDKFTAKAQDVDQMERVDDAYFHTLFDLPEETLYTWYFCKLEAQKEQLVFFSSERPISFF